MKRREILRAGVGLVALSSLRHAFGATPCPPGITGTSEQSCPGAVGETDGPAWYSRLSVNDARVFPGSAHQSNLGRYPGTSGNETGDTTLYSYSGGVLNTRGLYDGALWRPGPWLCLHGGGHEAYSGNEIAAFGPLTDDNPGWIWACPANPVNNAPSNGNQPASQHSYAYLEYISSKNQLFVPLVNNRYSDSSTDLRSFAFDFGVSNPAENINTAWQPVSDIPSGGKMYGGTLGCYDDFSDIYWIFVGRGETYLARYDVGSNSWTRFPRSGFFATLSYSDRQVCAIDPVTKVIMIASAPASPNDSRLRCLDSRDPSTGVYFPSGSNHPNGSGGLLFDPVNRRWVYYEGGDTMYVCPVPRNPYAKGDSFDFSPVAVRGDSVPRFQTKSGYGGGVWNRFRFCPNPQGYVFSGGWSQNVSFIRA